jgi:tRNA(Ile)-lysidine synthase
VNWIQIKTNLLRRFPPDAPYLIGVSGGRDSVVLLHWLIDVCYDKLIVCHFNHQLRGRSADADARFVQKLARKYRADFELGSANIRALAKKKRLSIETAAREARYAFFAKIAQRRGCHTVFLAHHADDLVETFLVNLMRGAGLTGLAAMRDVSTRRVNDAELTLVRPFLPIWRKEIDKYVREQRLNFREDASNKDLAPVRNRIRHRVLPYLEKTLGRNIRRNIWRTTIIAGEEEDWISNQFANSTDARLSVADLRELPIALQRRAILQWLRAQNISDIGFEVVEEVRSLAEPDARHAKVNLPRDRYARRRAGKIFLE